MIVTRSRFKVSYVPSPKLNKLNIKNMGIPKPESPEFLERCHFQVKHVKLGRVLGFQLPSPAFVGSPVLSWPLQLQKCSDPRMSPWEMLWDSNQAQVSNGMECNGLSVAQNIYMYMNICVNM